MASGLDKPYIIAEIASAHEGRLDFALELANHAVNAGADAVKFQIFNRGQLLSSHNPYFHEFGEIELSAKEWSEILARISSQNVEIIVEPYDVESLNIAEKEGVVKGYKIPAAGIAQTELLENIKKTEKPVFIAVGGAEWHEIEHAVSAFRGSSITLLCGFQNFPTSPKDSKLYQIRTLKEAFECAVGYADHVDAEDTEMSRLLPALAVIAGATVIEKHIIADRSSKGRDYYSALNPVEFKDFVQLIRGLPEIIGGETEWCLSEAELKYRQFSKRQAVAKRGIAIGTKLDLKEIAFKRTNQKGLSFMEISRFAGRELLHSKTIDEPLTEEDFNDG